MRTRHITATLSAIALLSASIITPTAFAQDTTSSGRQTATTVLETLTVTDTQADNDGYTQDSFKYWDKQPQLGTKATTADLIMVRDFDPASVKSTDGDVDEGTLKNDPYTGLDITYHRGDGNSIDIEHVVARSEAWDSGANKWSAEKRQQFANDPLELMAVSSSGNRAHGEKDAAGWLPSKGSSFGTNASYDCKYVARQIAVKAKYELSVDKAEKQAMQTVLATCPTQTIPLDTDGLYWEDNTAPTAKGKLEDLAYTRMRINGALFTDFDYTQSTIPTQRGLTGAPALQLDNLPEGWTQSATASAGNSLEPDGTRIEIVPSSTLTVFDPNHNKIMSYHMSADPDMYNTGKTDDGKPEETPTQPPTSDAQTTPAPTSTTTPTPSTTKPTTQHAQAHAAQATLTQQLANTGISASMWAPITLILLALGTTIMIFMQWRKDTHE